MVISTLESPVQTHIIIVDKVKYQKINLLKIYFFLKYVPHYFLRNLIFIINGLEISLILFLQVVRLHLSLVLFLPFKV